MSYDTVPGESGTGVIQQYCCKSVLHTSTSNARCMLPDNVYGSWLKRICVHGMSNELPVRTKATDNQRLPYCCTGMYMYCCPQAEGHVPLRTADSSPLALGLYIALLPFCPWRSPSLFTTTVAPRSMLDDRVFKVSGMAIPRQLHGHSSLACCDGQSEARDGSGLDGCGATRGSAECKTRRAGCKMSIW